MKKFATLLIIFLSILFIPKKNEAQEIPLVYEEENTCSECPEPYLPSINELPVITNLPDPFEWSDGRGRMKNKSDWKYRRNEIKAEIEHYEIGEKPEKPDTIEASYSNGTLTVVITENGKTLTLTSAVSLPEGEGPFPAVIGMNSPSGSIPASVLTSRNIARITYSHNQVTTYGSQQNGDPYYQLYPHLNATNTGQYSAWAWGVSRLIDGLELVQDVLPIDLEHIAVTGCSYAGKMALFSGALDERIALTISVESGGGGYTTWRYSQEIDKTVSVETLGKTDHNWFKEDMWQFQGNNVSKLPHDHHELMAMVAPRALLVTGNPDYVWLADESGHVGSNAAKEVYDALGISDRFGYSIVGGHSHCAIPNSQLPEIEAFIDKYLLGIDTVNTNIATTPYNTNLAPWINWDTPELSDGTSYFGFATLVFPANNQSSLDTSFTFTWNKAEGADKYLFQLSTDPGFNSLVVIDSTTDTTKNISGLLQGVKYYWRVRAKSQDEYGLYSEIRNFYTFIPVPDAPDLISATSYENTNDSFTFSWSKVEYAEKYILQFSHAETFATIFKRDSVVADTFKVLGGFAEGRKEYWRVSAKNVEGTSNWTESSFTTKLIAPTNLVLEKNESNKIELQWTDNSVRESGYIIERKQNSNDSFTVLDTITGVTYLDENVEAGPTYTYKVKAFNDVSESDYSNEASLSITGIKGLNEIPTEYSLNQNYPNPFNPVTKIKFGLPQASLTKVTIYDLLGGEITTLINKELEAGYHEINFDAADLPSGVYLYRIQAGDFISTKKMILMK